MATTNGTNDSSALASFVQRKRFRDQGWLPKPDWPSPIDLWYDKPYYGRIDHRSNAVVLSNQNIKKFNNRTKNVYGVNFVVDAFEDFKQYFAIAVNTNKIDSLHSNLVVFEAKYGWVDLDKEYTEYIRLLYKSFNGAYLANGKDNKISGFTDFLKYFKNFLKISLPKFPFTKTGFILSKRCSPRTSGLVIDLWDEDPGNDSIKWNKVLDDPNFIFYAYAAQRYGFKIDKNVPWRLVADIDSPVMKKYMENYPPVPNISAPVDQLHFSGDIVTVEGLDSDPTLLKIATPEEVNNPPRFRVREVDLVNGIMFLSPVPGYESHAATTGQMYMDLQKSGINIDDPSILRVTEGANRLSFSKRLTEYKRAIREWNNIPKITPNSLFDVYYQKAYLDDIELLIEWVLKYYNHYVRTNPTSVIKKYSSCSEKTIKTIIDRRTITEGQMMTQYKNDFWLEFYAEIRAIEVGWNYTEVEYKDFMKRIRLLYKAKGYRAALDFINQNLGRQFKPKNVLTPGQKHDNIFDMLVE